MPPATGMTGHDSVSEFGLAEAQASGGGAERKRHLGKTELR